MATLNNSMNTNSKSIAKEAQRASTGLEEILHGAGERIGEVTSNITETASQYMEDGRTYVKQNPEKAIAVAALAGAAVGSLITLAICRRE